MKTDAQKKREQNSREQERQVGKGGERWRKTLSSGRRKYREWARENKAHNRGNQADRSGREMDRQAGGRKCASDTRLRQHTIDVREKTRK